MKKIFSISLMAMVCLILSSCRGCPEDTRVYAVFSNMTDNVVVLDIRSTSNTGFIEKEITLEPNQEEDIFLYQYTSYTGSKAFSRPRFLCDKDEPTDRYRAGFEYSSLTVSAYTICEPDFSGTSEEFEIFPIEIRDIGEQCLDGYIEIVQGF